MSNLNSIITRKMVSRDLLTVKKLIQEASIARRRLTGIIEGSPLTKDDHLFVAESVNGVICGIIKIKKVDDRGRLSLLYVNSSCRRRGIGLKLVSVCTKYGLLSLKCSRCEALIYKANQVSKKTFSKAGYRCAGLINLKSSWEIWVRT